MIYSPSYTTTSRSYETSLEKLNHFVEITGLTISTNRTAAQPRLCVPEMPQKRASYVLQVFLLAYLTSAE